MAKKRTSPIAIIFVCLITVIVLGILIFKVFPSKVEEVPDVPTVGRVVSVITSDKYEFQEGGYEAEIVTPEISGMLDEDVQNELNEKFKENSRILIEHFENDIKDLQGEFGDDTVHYGIVLDYVIKTDNDDILAIDYFTYTVAGSSSTTHSFYTIDKNTGELLTLSGLFEAEADYITPISQYIKTEMERLNEEEDGMFWLSAKEDGFSQIKAEQNFFINDDGNLVICFDKYEVAAGAQGSPEFVIPYNVISDIASYDKLR